MQVCPRIALASRKTSSAIISAGSPTAQKVAKEVVQMDMNSLSHSKWECKYHVVFAPKFRRKVIYSNGT